MTDRELMQWALEALNRSDYLGWQLNIPIIKALRARLAEPEQEPVAWITDGGKGELWWHQSVKFDDDGNLIGENPDDIPLYTTPPQREWQTLTDEEMFSLWVRCPAETEDRFAFARAIEQALKEKNT